MMHADPTVVLIDPQPLFRLGVEAALQTGPRMQVVASVNTGAEGLAALRRTRPAAALIELRLPDMRGPTLLQAAVADELPTRVVVLTAESDGAAIYEALGAGAAGYLAKDTSAEDLATALRTIIDGDTVISPKLHRLVAAEIRLHAVASDFRLTPRERQVLALVAEGCSSIEIGDRLFVSHTPVKTHLAHAYEKLGVSDRAAAVVQALKHGLLDAA